MHPFSTSRRVFLTRSTRLSVVSAILMTTSSCGKKISFHCVDPDELSESELGLRQSLQYVDVSVKPKQRCNNCAFYSASENTGCGTCEIFMGGSVPAIAYCSGWSEHL